MLIAFSSDFLDRKAYKFQHALNEVEAIPVSLGTGLGPEQIQAELLRRMSRDNSDEHHTHIFNRSEVLVSGEVATI